MTVDDNALASIIARLDVTLGKMTEQQQRRNELQRRASMVESPRYIPFHATVTLSSAGFAVASFDNKGPDQGHLWNVMQLAVVGLSPATTVAGRADVFISAADYRTYTTLLQAGSQDWMDTSATLPNVAFYSHNQMPLRLNEELYVIISGGTNGQQVIVKGIAMDFQEGAISQEWTQ